MRNLNNGAVLFNIGGGAVLLTVLGYIGYSFLRTDGPQSCTLSYPPGMRFSLQNKSGAAMTPLELQARTGMRGWGVLENATVEKTVSGPSDFNLKVNLVATGEQQDARSGVGFVWQPAKVGKAQSACLSYSVYFPDKFAFGDAGYLPGLYAASDIRDFDAGNSDSGYAARIGWHQFGSAGIEVRTPGAGGFWQGTGNNFTWPVGRWVKIEQEIVPSRKQGSASVVRMWVDGKLRAENEAAQFNADKFATFSGVVADIGYTNPMDAATSVSISPFVLQWR